MIDRERLVKRFGALSTDTITEVLDGQQEMFVKSPSEVEPPRWSPRRILEENRTAPRLNASR